jgi:hypothetical protein
LLKSSILQGFNFQFSFYNDLLRLHVVAVDEAQQFETSGKDTKKVECLIVSVKKMATLLESPLVYDFDVNRHLHIPERKVR